MGATRPSSLTSALSDIRLLLWKNFKIQWRHPVQSLVELLLPCLLVFILSMFRGSVEVTYFPDATLYKNFHLTDVDSKLFPTNSTFAVMYTSDNKENGAIMAEAVQMLKDALKINFKPMPFNDSTTMEHYYLTAQNVIRDGQVLCGVEFVEMSRNKIHFKLRFASVPRYYATSNIRENWETIHLMPELTSPGPREKSKVDGGKPGYAREGYLLMQHTIILAAAKVLQNPPKHKQEFNWSLARFPFPPYVSDLFLFALSFLFPAVIVFSFIYSSVNLTKNLVIEKERRINQFLKMAGLKELEHWISHFLHSIIWSLPSLVILVVLLCVKLKEGIAILNFSNPFLLFLFFFIYETNNICLCFMISTFFSKANLAGIATGVIFFFTFLPFFTVVAQYSTISSALKIIYCFLPNTNMAFGIYIMAMKESRAVGIDWSTISEPALPGDILNLLLILGLMLVNSVIYLLVTWYTTQAFPGEYGVALPWYFPFTLDYWKGGKDQEFSELANIKSENDQENVEKDPFNLRAGIKIVNLSKSYDGKTYSVSNLNLNIFHGQITALLGHNGAGKTTTISILTGLFKPSSGTALVNGYDIRTNMNAIRSSLGICPQYNVLFDELTVTEHLEFYCKLKRADLNANEIKQEVKSIIEKLDLTDKQKVQSSKLSGGMKRKLCVGIALIGGSKVVFLDEPTSGMDVSARRFIWDLLLKEKEHRSILISTHFMEEADILGDRIAIMAGGKLQCCGSPLFLKKRYGTGYGLTVAKRNTKVETETINEMILKHIDSAKLESSVGTEVTYSLPDDKTELFEPLLSELESNENISNYGISVTTMEEVFLKVGDYAKNKIESMTDLNERQKQLDTNSKPVARNYGLTLLSQQLSALVMKKIIFSARSPFLTGAQLLIPFLILNMTLLSLKAIPRLKESPPLHMELNQFHNPQVTYFYDPTVQQVASKYADAIRSQIASSEKIIGIPNTDPTVIATKIISSPISVYNYQYMISAIISQNSTTNITTLTGLFNNQAFHTPSIALKYIDEAYIRYVYGQSNLSITVTNLPLPLLTVDNLKMSVMTNQTQFQVMQGLILAISFLVGSFAVLAVKERVTMAKHIQKLSGVRVSVYWLSYFLTDYVFYLLSSCLMVIAFVIYKENGLYQDKQPFYLALGFVLHGFAILPCVYALSFMFNAPATAYARICLYVTVLGIASILSDQITSIKALDLLNTNRILKPILSLFVPVYDLGKVAANLMQNYDTNKACNMDGVQFLCSLATTPEFVIPCCK
ncbi:phospholipid-transporting ATPase ABCA3-like, partial [Bombus terrestris]|uniref:Phospholipid-transporting ATPase ABCA3-like n=1 Tax=Bombus terrestris TaxID=30195 RepID=A0A9C6SZX3_BOMTE